MRRRWRSRACGPPSAGKEILRGIDLTVSSGEVHAVMGPNGAGKSTLSAVVMGKPGYEVLEGTVTLDGVDVLGMPTWERAAAGLHLVMQYPTEVPGVALDDMLREALDGPRRRHRRARRHAAGRGRRGSGSRSALLHRALNVDLSGGEKKRNETLQLAVLAAAHRHPRRARLRARHRRPAGLRPAHRGGDPAVRRRARASACWRSPTTTGCSAELRPDVVHILVRGQHRRRGRPRARRPARGRRATPRSPASRRTRPRRDVDRPAVRPGSLDELFADPLTVHPSVPRRHPPRTSDDLRHSDGIVSAHGSR